MAVDLIKQVHPRVVFVRYTGQWTVEDLEITRKKVQSLIGENPYHVIIDAHRTTSFPTSVKVIKLFLSDVHDPNLLWATTAHPDAGNVFFNMLNSIASQLTKSNTKYFQKLEQCVDFLKSVDVQLNNWVFTPQEVEE